MHLPKPKLTLGKGHSPLPLPLWDGSGGQYGFRSLIFF